MIFEGLVDGLLDDLPGPPRLSLAGFPRRLRFDYSSRIPSPDSLPGGELLDLLGAVNYTFRDQTLDPCPRVVDDLPDVRDRQIKLEEVFQTRLDTCGEWSPRGMLCPPRRTRSATRAIERRIGHPDVNEMNRGGRDHAERGARWSRESGFPPASFPPRCPSSGFRARRIAPEAAGPPGGRPRARDNPARSSRSHPRSEKRSQDQAGAQQPWISPPHSARR